MKIKLFILFNFVRNIYLIKKFDLMGKFIFIRYVNIY